MNRSTKKVETFEKGIVHIAGKVAIGAVGAVGTITPGTGHAVASVVRNSAGNYTITLKDGYPDFVGVKAWIAFATAGAVMNPALQVKPWAYTPNPATGGSTIVLQVVTLASPEVAADTPTGTEIHFEIMARNSKLTAAG